MKISTAIIIPIFTLSLVSCFTQKGYMTGDVCRPYQPKFKLLEIPLQEKEGLHFNKIYIADDFTKASGFGLYPDGRLIFLSSKNGFALQEEEVFGKNWDNASNIGYWRIENGKIKVEFFVCNESGYYLEKSGVIKGDTLVFYKNIYHPTRKETREERYIISGMSID